jgi:hypothetical protein
VIFRGLCASCAHFEHDYDRDRPVCAAFPNGIPNEIIQAGFDHRNEFPGDNGVRFTPLPDVTPEQVELKLKARPGVTHDA